MSRRVEKGTSDASGGKPHEHRGKFTEGLLDSDLIVKTLNVVAGQTILDAGCGTGYMSKAFSAAVGPSGKVYALDPDSHFIETLAGETRGTNIETIVADITKPTPLAESSVDLIYISTVIHIFSGQQMQGLVREAQRLLKPDGLLAIVEIEKKELPFGPPMNRKRSPEELIEIVPLASVVTVAVAEHFYLQVFQNAGN
jgi:ubiquinone/menaquinone biosynthesis C-methylase UbiE